MYVLTSGVEKKPKNCLRSVDFTILFGLAQNSSARKAVVTLWVEFNTSSSNIQHDP